MEKSGLNVYISIIEPYKYNDPCSCRPKSLARKFIIKTKIKTVFVYENHVMNEATVFLGCKTCGGHDDLKR